LTLALRTAVAVVIAVLVGVHFQNKLREVDAAQLPIRVQPELLALSGLLYLMAHLCWSTFWVRLLHRQGVPVPWWIGLRAYYLSQFGKYVPGKVAVLGMRVVMLHPHGGRALSVAVTATYETLSSMSAGALLGVLFLPALGGALGTLTGAISGGTMVFVAIASLPVGLVVLNHLASWVVNRRRGPDAPPIPAPSIWLLAQGLLHGACGYGLLALALSVTVRGVIPDAPVWTLAAYTADIATVGLSYVAGFVFFFAPGGLGTRELVMQLALTPQFAPAYGEQAAGLAIIVAIMLRLTWTAAEVVIGVPLYFLRPTPPPHAHYEALMSDSSPEGPPPPTPLPEGKGEPDLRSSVTSGGSEEALRAFTPLPSGRGAGGVGFCDLLSLVIPVYNERESLAALHAEIAEVAAKLRERVEVIFIDDGSVDDSWGVIREIATKDDRVRGIKFRRNFGKAAALAAGFGAARGDVILTMDADLQDDPHEIPHFLEKLRGGLDVVSGWKKVRHDPWHKVFPSRVFNRFLSVLTGVYLHDHNCGMKAYRAEALREVHLYGEMHRFVPVLAYSRGFKVGEQVIQHRARKFGRSKYGWKRFIKGGLDVMTVRLLTGFGRRPQHLIGAWGLGFFAAALFGFFALVVNLLVRQFEPDVGAGPFAQMAVLVLSVGLGLLGTQCLLTGLLAEMTVARKWLDNEPYSVAERTDAC